MQITTQTVRDDDGTELGETHEVGRALVYQDRNGYLAIDVPSRLSAADAEALHTLLGKVLGKMTAAATGRA